MMRVCRSTRVRSAHTRVNMLGRLVIRTTVVRVVLIAIVATAPAVLPSLAYASPPDPSWVLGIYDDADCDDVVTLVASATGTLGPMALSDVRPIARPSENLPS